MVRGDAARDVTLVGVSVPLTALARGVLLDDDVPAIESYGWVIARAETVPANGRPLAEVAREVEVRVFVDRGGYEPLEFTWRAGDEPRIRHMVRRE